MSEESRVRFQITTTRGREYQSDWIPLDKSVDRDEAREVLLDQFNNGVARGGLLMFNREGRKIGLACTAVELIEVLIEGEQS